MGNSNIGRPNSNNWTVAELVKWHARTPKPKSVYDKLPAEYRPFSWAIPAPTESGIPTPWRVANADNAKRMLGREFSDRDIYVAHHHDDVVKGHLSIWIGLSDNRVASIHAERLESIADGLRGRGLRVKFTKSKPYATLYLIDDLATDVLRKRHGTFYPSAK